MSRTKKPFQFMWISVLVFAAFLAGAAFTYAQNAQAIITSPRSFSTLRGVVSINGTAAHPSFQRFQLYFRSESVPDEWHFMSEQTNQVTNGLLGTWDTRGVPDGTYALRLRVVRQDGNYDEQEVNGLSVANTRPVNTPTPEETPTEIAPTEPTATPTDIFTPTPVTVEQPQIATPTPRPSTEITSTTPLTNTTPSDGTPISSGETTNTTGNGTSALGDLLGGNNASSTLSLSGLRDAFLSGARFTLIAFVLLGLYIGLKWLIRWASVRRRL